MKKFWFFGSLAILLSLGSPAWAEPTRQIPTDPGDTREITEEIAAYERFSEQLESEPKGSLALDGLYEDWIEHLGGGKEVNRLLDKGHSVADAHRNRILELRYQQFKKDIETGSTWRLMAQYGLDPQPGSRGEALSTRSMRILNLASAVDSSRRYQSDVDWDSLDWEARDSFFRGMKAYAKKQRIDSNPFMETLREGGFPSLPDGPGPRPESVSWSQYSQGYHVGGERGSYEYAAGKEWVQRQFEHWDALKAWNRKVGTWFRRSKDAIHPKTLEDIIALSGWLGRAGLSPIEALRGYVEEISQGRSGEELLKDIERLKQPLTRLLNKGGDELLAGLFDSALRTAIPKLSTSKAVYDALIRNDLDITPEFASLLARLPSSPQQFAKAMDLELADARGRKKGKTRSSVMFPMIERAAPAALQHLLTPERWELLDEKSRNKLLDSTDPGGKIAKFALNWGLEHYPDSYDSGAMQLASHFKNGLEKAPNAFDLEEWKRVAFKLRSEGVDRLLEGFLSQSGPVLKTLGISDRELNGLLKEFRGGPKDALRSSAAREGLRPPSLAKRAATFARECTLTFKGLAKSLSSGSIAKQ